MSVGIIAAAITLFGPLAGPYAVILLSALAGALWALAAAPTTTRRQGALLLLRQLLTAVALTGSVAWWLEKSYDWPVHHIIAPIAFAIGMGVDRVRGAIGVLADLRSKLKDGQR